uniref:NADH dehydrogenase subunit 6 n=1 Tax=Cyclina sinensis TaxID=120566 RepID=A0A125S9U3_CYCSN|nr:NADH dehydrogenase subunit 6 [Cyclina sinensis]
MVEMFVFFFFGLFFQYSMFYSHPLVLGMSLLGISVVMVSIMCFYGPIFSFCIFMVMIAGVLVVFSYTISLVPYEGPDYKEGKVVDFVSLGISESGVFGIIKKNFFESFFGFVFSDFFRFRVFVGFLFFLVVFMFLYQSLVGLELSGAFLGYSDIGYFSEDYSMVLVWLGSLLFFVMIFGTGMASRYNGALIG